MRGPFAGHSRAKAIAKEKPGDQAENSGDREKQRCGDRPRAQVAVGHRPFRCGERLAQDVASLRPVRSRGHKIPYQGHHVAYAKNVAGQLWRDLYSEPFLHIR